MTSSFNGTRISELWKVCRERQEVRKSWLCYTYTAQARRVSNYLTCEHSDSSARVGTSGKEKRQRFRSKNASVVSGDEIEFRSWQRWRRRRRRSSSSQQAGCELGRRERERGMLPFCVSMCLVRGCREDKRGHSLVRVTGVDRLVSRHLAFLCPPTPPTPPTPKCLRERN